MHDEPTLGRGFIQDPHTMYNALRAQSPVHRVVMWGGVHVWLVTSYAEARMLLTDPRLTKDGDRLAELLPDGADVLLGPSLRDHMLLKDPPDHTRLRTLAAEAFTARSIDRLRPLIERVTDELLTELPDGRADLINAFAIPLPLRVIGDFLGVAPEDGQAFRSVVGPILTHTDPDDLRLAEVALVELLSALVERKRMTPADDLVTRLVAATDQADRFTENELLSTLFLLILAGYETTVNLIGNGILALLRAPEQLEILRTRPALIPNAIEEFLRFDSPINIATVRATTEVVRISGTDIPARELVMISLSAANRDGDQFRGADQLDVTRGPNAHLAFGHGRHYCLGAPLARLEGRIAIEKFVTAFDFNEVDASNAPMYRSSILMRGLTSLPVGLRRRALFRDR